MGSCNDLAWPGINVLAKPHRSVRCFGVSDAVQFYTGFLDLQFLLQFYIDRLLNPSKGTPWAAEVHDIMCPIFLTLS